MFQSVLSVLRLAKRHSFDTLFRFSIEQSALQDSGTLEPLEKFAAGWCMGVLQEVQKCCKVRGS
jgi:hypothetical protein